MKVSILISLLCASFVSARSVVDDGGHANILTLDILHVNDIHAHFEETNENLGRCTEADLCVGGVARKESFHCR